MLSPTLALLACFLIPPLCALNNPGAVPTLPPQSPSCMSFLIQSRPPHRPIPLINKKRLPIHPLGTGPDRWPLTRCLLPFCVDLCLGLVQSLHNSHLQPLLQSTHTGICRTDRSHCPAGSLALIFSSLTFFFCMNSTELPPPQSLLVFPW